MSRRRCADVDPDIFHDDVPAAKKVCRRCPVLIECLLWAVDTPALQGVLGGTTERERRKLRKIQKVKR